MSAILEEIHGELSADGITAAEVRLDARQAQNPEDCAKTIVCALVHP